MHVFAKTPYRGERWNMDLERAKRPWQCTNSWKGVEESENYFLTSILIRSFNPSNGELFHTQIRLVYTTQTVETV